MTLYSEKLVLDINVGYMELDKRNTGLLKSTEAHLDIIRWMAMKRVKELFSTTTSDGENFVKYNMNRFEYDYIYEMKSLKYKCRT